MAYWFTLQEVVCNVERTVSQVIWSSHFHVEPPDVTRKRNDGSGCHFHLKLGPLRDS